MQEEQRIQEEQEGGLHKSKELKLLNSGAFGCIYSPNLTCNGNIGSENYITKIQKSERSIKHELKVSEKIRKIVGYARFFAPVLKSCKVKIAKDRLKDLKKCEVFEKEPEEKIEESTYVSMKIRHVGDSDLKKHLLSNTKIPHFLSEIWRTHAHLLKGIQKLFANGIVHYDLKYNNIILDKHKNTPIIIDFGQSWVINELRTADEINAAFFVFDQYDYWCIDVLICNYAIQEVGLDKYKTELVTEAEIEQIYDMFMYGKTPKYESGSDNKKKLIVNDAYRYGILQNPQKMSNFKQVLYQYLNPFINKSTWQELYDDLVKRSNTWDCYSIAIIYLNMLDDVYLSNANLYNKLLNSSGYRLRKYVELMEHIIYSAPNNRPSVQFVAKELDEIKQ